MRQAPEPVRITCAHCGVCLDLDPVGRGRPRKHCSTACRRAEDADRKRQIRARRARILAAAEALTDDEVQADDETIAACFLGRLRNGGDDAAPRQRGGAFSGTGPQRRRVLKAVS